MSGFTARSDEREPGRRWNGLELTPAMGVGGWIKGDLVHLLALKLVVVWERDGLRREMDLG